MWKNSVLLVQKVAGRNERECAFLVRLFPRLLRCRKDLGQFAEVLGGGGEEKFVVCAAWAA